MSPEGQILSTIGVGEEGRFRGSVSSSTWIMVGNAIAVIVVVDEYDPDITKQRLSRTRRGIEQSEPADQFLSSFHPLEHRQSALESHWGERESLQLWDHFLWT
jgi:hypothetical protein